MTGSRPQSRAQSVVAAIIVPLLIAVLTTPFWLEKLFGAVSGSTDSQGTHSTIPSTDPLTTDGTGASQEVVPGAASSLAEEIPSLAEEIPTLALGEQEVVPGAASSLAEEIPSLAEEIPTIYLSSDSGGVGATVLVSGTGFGVEEAVQINVGTIDCARTTTGRDGKFSQVACVIPDWYASFRDVDVDLNATGRSTLKYDRRSFHLT